MNKTDFASYLDSLNPDQLKNQLATLFEKFQVVRDYYGFQKKVFDPRKLERYREKIIKALHPDHHWQGGLNIESVDHTLQSFRNLDPEDRYVVELYCFAMKEASELADQYGGDFGEDFYIYFEELFDKLLLELFQKGVIDQFKDPLEDVVWSATEAFGHQDTLKDSFTEYYK